MSVADGTVFVGSERGLWALAAADGRERWHAQVGRDDVAVAAPPAVADGLAGLARRGLAKRSVVDRRPAWEATVAARAQFAEGRSA